MEQYYNYGHREDGKKKKKSASRTSSGLWHAPSTELAEVFPENGVAAAAQFDAVFDPKQFEANSWVQTARDVVVRTALVHSGEVAYLGIIGQTTYAMPVLEMGIGDVPHVFIPVRKDTTDNGALPSDWKDTRKKLRIVSGKQTDPTDVVCHPVVHDKPFSG